MGVENDAYEWGFMDTNRRRVLSTAMATAGGVVAGCATSGGGVKTATPFDVAMSVIPIVGTAQVSPVRRIYCVG